MNTLDNYNKNVIYLLNNNISKDIALEYAKYPSSTMIYLIDLYKSINKEAYNILMNIPGQLKVKLFNVNIKTENIETVIKILKYNYVWGKILLEKNININLVKLLLNEYKEFHFFELCFINELINDYNKSFDKMIRDRNETLKYKETFYKFKKYGINLNYAYTWCKYEDHILNKIFKLIENDYSIMPMLIIANILTETQMNFLTLSRCAYSDIETFKIYRNNIFDNALNFY